MSHNVIVLNNLHVRVQNYTDMVLGIFKKRKVTYDDASYGCEVQIVRLQGKYKNSGNLKTSEI